MPVADPARSAVVTRQITWSGLGYGASHWPIAEIEGRQLKISELLFCESNGRKMHELGDRTLVGDAHRKKCIL